MRTYGKKQPMALDEMRAQALGDDCNRPGTPSKRTFQRALRQMVLDGVLITTGRGVRGDPFRYSANPAHIVKQSVMEDDLVSPFRTKH